jgi:hypothetical protein
MTLRKGYTFLPAMRRAAASIAATLVLTPTIATSPPLRRVV